MHVESSMRENLRFNFQQFSNGMFRFTSIIQTNQWEEKKRWDEKKRLQIVIVRCYGFNSLSINSHHHVSCSVSVSLFHPLLHIDQIAVQFIEDPNLQTVSYSHSRYIRIQNTYIVQSLRKLCKYIHVHTEIVKIMLKIDSLAQLY